MKTQLCFYVILCGLIPCCVSSGFEPQLVVECDKPIRSELLDVSVFLEWFEQEMKCLRVMLVPVDTKGQSLLMRRVLRMKCPDTGAVAFCDGPTSIRWFRGLGKELNKFRNVKNDFLLNGNAARERFCRFLQEYLDSGFCDDVRDFLAEYGPYGVFLKAVNSPLRRTNTDEGLY